MPIAELNEADRAALLAEFPGWTLREDGKAIARMFTFADFNEAFGFIGARRALCRQGRSSPRMVQRLQPGRDDADHARCGLSARDAAMARFIEGIL